MSLMNIIIVWFQKISIPPPHGGSRNFLGVGGFKRDKLSKGRGVHKETFFPEGLKCDRINTYILFPTDSGNQEKRKVLSVEIEVGFLVIYFALLFRHQTTHTALRHTSKYHVWRWVKQNGRQEKYRSQSPNIGRIERTYRERMAIDCWQSVFLSKFQQGLWGETFSLTYRGEFQQYDEDDDLVYILYFKDCAVFSLNATGAFSDGIIRAVSWFEIINIAFTHVSYPCEVQFPANFKASITRLSQSFIVIHVVTSLEMLAKSIQCHLSWCIIFCNRERRLETTRIHLVV